MRSVSEINRALEAVEILIESSTYLLSECDGTDKEGAQSALESASVMKSVLEWAKGAAQQPGDFAGLLRQLEVLKAEFAQKKYSVN